MRPILQQPTSLSYSPFLALPAPKIAGLLPARVGPPPKIQPPPLPLLCAPRIAGLLPAKCAQPRIEIIRPPRTHAELLARLGPIRSRDEMNAELIALLRTPQERVP